MLSRFDQNEVAALDSLYAIFGVDVLYNGQARKVIVVRHVSGAQIRLARGEVMETIMFTIRRFADRGIESFEQGDSNREGDQLVYQNLGVEKTFSIAQGVEFDLTSNLEFELTFHRLRPQTLGASRRIPLGFGGA